MSWVRPKISAWVFSTPWFALSLLWVGVGAGWAQQSRNTLYFSIDEVRLARLTERKQLLNYQVVPLSEQRYRETCFDTAELFLFRQGMYYCLRESFSGQAQLDFYRPGPRSDGPSPGILRSVTLPPRKVAAAREGKLDDKAIQKRLSLPTGREFKTMQLVAEYAHHGLALELGGREEILIRLWVGSVQGFSGKRLNKRFWAVEVQAIGARPTPAKSQEMRRIIDYLKADLRLKTNAKNLYAYGIERTVLLSSFDRQIRPVSILGGGRGNGFDQFDLPDAVAFTLDGRLLVSDTDNMRFKIYRFADQSQTVQIVGREGSGPGEFSHSVAAMLGNHKVYNQVQGVAVDRHGLIYVVDQGNRRVQVFNAEGRVLPEKEIPWSYCGRESPRCVESLWRPSKGNEYSSIQGLAVDSDGALYLSDKGMGRVYRLLPGGKLDRNFNPPELDRVTGKRMLREPESMAVHQDKLLVASEGSGDIKILDRLTGKLQAGGDGFGRDVFDGDVEGLAVLDHYLFAVDPQNTRIAVFDLRPEQPRFLLGLVGDHESADGIAVDPTGKYVAVADQGNARVVLYSLSEILDHLAGRKLGG
jgi:sugar lactone lactonase YvrE